MDTISLSHIGGIDWFGGGAKQRSSGGACLGGGDSAFRGGAGGASHGIQHRSMERDCGAAQVGDGVYPASQCSGLLPRDEIEECGRDCFWNFLHEGARYRIRFCLSDSRVGPASDGLGEWIWFATEPISRCGEFTFLEVGDGLVDGRARDRGGARASDLVVGSRKCGGSESKEKLFSWNI